MPRLRQRAGWDFPGGAVAKTQLPVGGAEVRSLVRENPHAATETQCSQIIFFLKGQDAVQKDNGSGAILIWGIVEKSSKENLPWG